jgi:hypothetical protein
VFSLAVENLKRDIGTLEHEPSESAFAFWTLHEVCYISGSHPQPCLDRIPGPANWSLFLYHPYLAVPFNPTSHASSSRGLRFAISAHMSQE